MPSRPATRRGGFTLFEMLLALALLILVLTLTVSVYITQSRAVDRTSAQTEAQRSAMFAGDQIDQELRNAGIGAVNGQPMLIYGDGFRLAFNADLTTARVNDPFAVFHDPDADSVAVGGLTPATQITVGGMTYPVANYRTNAETIVYWTEPDSSTFGITVHRLMRRVNQRDPEVVARHLLLEPGQPVFRYFKTAMGGGLEEILGSRLPMRHTAPLHDSPADTGASAISDSVELVSMRLIGVYRDNRGQMSYDTVTRSIRIQNAGLIRNDQCGSVPLVPTAVDAVAMSATQVRIRWNKSMDDGDAENDVRSYALFRRLAAAPLSATEPIANIPANGAATYEFWDDGRETGEELVYTLVATDCTPAPSPTVTFPTVTMP